MVATSVDITESRVESWLALEQMKILVPVFTQRRSGRRNVFAERRRALPDASTPAQLRDGAAHRQQTLAVAFTPRPVLAADSGKFCSRRR